MFSGVGGGLFFWFDLGCFFVNFVYVLVLYGYWIVTVLLEWLGYARALCLYGLTQSIIMVPLSERRHRIYESEITAVKEGLKLLLLKPVPVLNRQADHWPIRGVQNEALMVEKGLRFRTRKISQHDVPAGM